MSKIRGARYLVFGFFAIAAVSYGWIFKTYGLDWSNDFPAIDFRLLAAAGVYASLAAGIAIALLDPLHRERPSYPLAASTQKLIAIAAFAFPIPALMYCGAYAYSANTPDDAVLEKMSGLEQSIFGKSKLVECCSWRHGDVDFGPYMADLQREIKNAWHPPTLDKSQRTVVQFRVDRDGAVSELKLTKASKLASEDTTALAAVQSAAPFDKLPTGAPDYVDIQFTFDYSVFLGNEKI